MSNENWTIKNYAAFERAVNIELCNAVLALAAETSTEPQALAMYRKIADNMIWGNNSVNYEEYFAQCGLRYLGEILERYEEHFGDETQNTRAVALALGYAAPFLEQGMFIGSQKENFLRKLERVSDSDVYLLGAKYMLESNADRAKDILDGLTNREYQGTEEAVFVLSLYEDKTLGFERMQHQLSLLWGEKRSLFLDENIGVLEWMIAKYKQQITGCRKKEASVLRALVKLPLMNAKQDTPVYQALVNAGYSELEIVYANSRLLWASRIRDRLNGDSIPAEKIAVRLLISYLNSKDAHSEDTYDYLKWLFCEYETFVIKYEGNKGIWEAICDKLDPTQPKTVLWMVQNIKRDAHFPYRFDVFNSDWDVLAKELPVDRYSELFTEQMLQLKEPTKEDLERWIDRYRQLTERDYFKYFSHNNCYDDEAFSLLVEKGNICLWKFFKEHLSENEKENEFSRELSKILNYVKNVNTREGFDFWQQFFEDFDFTEITDVFGRHIEFHNGFLQNTGRYYSNEKKLDFYREFLTDDENRQLFEWIEESAFRINPGDYSEFVRSALETEQLITLYAKEELGLILRSLIDADAIPKYNINTLKTKYFSSEELEEDRLLEEAKLKAEKQKQERLDLEEKKAKLYDMYNGTFESLCRYEKKYYLSSEKKKALNLLHDNMISLAASSKVLSKEEFSSFLRLCDDYVQYDAIAWADLKKVMEMMIRRGYDAENK